MHAVLGSTQGRFIVIEAVKALPGLLQKQSISHILAAFTEYVYIEVLPSSNGYFFQLLDTNALPFPTEPSPIPPHFQ
jgi:hypothetical protein